jgi:5-methylcytosine-specific restriction endonuclease McrA
VRLELDHIAAVADGGAEWDVENLELLCTICHKAKSAREARARARRRSSSSGIRRSGIPTLFDGMDRLGTSRRW